MGARPAPADRGIVGASLGDLGLHDVGLDAATGKVLWRKYTLPGEPAARSGKAPTTRQRVAAQFGTPGPMIPLPIISDLAGNLAPPV
jgi:hypothetical protein